MAKFIVLFMLLLVIVACGLWFLAPQFATDRAGRLAKEDMVAAAPAPTLIPTSTPEGSEITITIEEYNDAVLGAIQQQQVHDERMADRIVSVAQSADEAQKWGQIGASFGPMIMPCGAGIVGLIALFALVLGFGRKPSP